jgi:hypothetical protein
MMESPSDSGPEYLSELRLAWSSENENQASMKALLKTL